MEEFLKRFQKLGFGGSAPPPPPAIDSHELERLIQSAVRTALAARGGGEPERGGRGGAPAPPPPRAVDPQGWERRTQGAVRTALAERGGGDPEPDGPDDDGR